MSLFQNVNLAVGSESDDGLQTIFNPPGYRGGGFTWSAFQDNPPAMVFARAGDDFIYTGSGNDVIFAGAGDDWIDAGPGNDVMFGGPGADTFVFNVYYPSGGDYADVIASGGVGHGNRDQIMDFEQGIDKIDVSRWQSFSYGTGEEFFIGKGEVGAVGSDLMVFFRHEGGSTVITLAREIYPPADGGQGPIIMQEIELRGMYDLQHGDFIFNVG